MKKSLILMAAVTVVSAGAALADDDRCRAPRDQWQPREAVMQMAAENGWTVRHIEIDDGCYEIKGRDGDGREIEAKIDPASLQIVEMEFEDDDDRFGARNPAPAGTVAPPQNGLFENGTPPRVQVN
ncbi:MAG: PepSY domain-containing protein [Pararhodobacter sp.]